MRAVGFFDSGFGGLSVLKQARAMLPNEHFIYYGDNANAPYGEKPVGEIRRLTRRGMDFLLERNVKALVIACNTATSVCAAELRAELKIPIIGIEPALKPAHFERHGGNIIVLATHTTLKLEKFRLLMERFGEGVVPIVGEGLVELVESGRQNSEEAEATLRKLLESANVKQTDGIVLGCTHYSFLADTIRKVAPNVPIFDGAEGTARQLRRVLEQNNLTEHADGRTEYYSSAGAETALRMENFVKA